MICRTCGKDSWHIVTRFNDEGQMEESCTYCGRNVPSSVNDVYFDKPGTHHEIYDEKGNVVHIESKQHKAYWMKKLHLAECGDRVRGATTYDPIYSRIARENLQKGGHHHG